ncbi:hypothetical protein ADL22_06525 [Streptomyces sp. NRRL F-4489]|uniref:hypothetical protein n=1 Tax=Streptomyces sp. NRRL F-4489 TaxID=1609095 RepID=UPI0007466709|nr:hypothetical protein [Streptomyces sp. NRRL F-4489]KUL51442.1 hypothetical protein ADL22_06525 [Streptomyces sp. NRRL F-4489]
MRPGRPGLVYVHGNGNKVRADLLRSQWDQALFGHDLAGLSRMAYWAPLRYASPLPDSAADEPVRGPASGAEAPARDAPGVFEPPEEFVARTVADARRESAASALEGRAAGGPEGGADEGPLVDWLREMTYFAETLGEAEAAGGAGEAGGGAAGRGEALPLEVLPLPRPLRTAVFRELVRRTFTDVHAYFFGGAGPAIREVVAQALDGPAEGPLIVIGHSLGSVAAYEVLREQEREVELLITLGSPLAIGEVRDHLARPPAVPAGVSAWRNVSDLRDLVALGHTLRPDFTPTELITDALVTNDSPNHHDVSAYLAQAAVREPVRWVTGQPA